MEFRILGALEVRDHQGRLLQLGGGRLRALLAILLLQPNQPVAADHLIDLLWADEPPASARHSLHLLVHRLRRVLATHGEAARLRTQDGAYLLEVHPDELDAERLEGLLRQGQAELSGGRAPAAVERFEAALALWHGPPLAQFRASAFARPAVARLEELHMAAATGHAEALLAQGRHADAVPPLEELIRRHPTRERLCELLMLALYRSGRQADALAAYRATRQALVEELGIEPGEELQRLQRAVLNRDPSLAAPAAPAATPAAGPPAPVTAEAPRDEAPAGRVAHPEPAERRVVTVLVARLKVDRSAWEDPEDRWTQYGQTMRLLREEVERLGGVVHTEIGETLVATFGTRRTRTDDPARAVRAALAMRAVAAAANATVTVGIDTSGAVVDAGAGPADPPRVTGEVVHSATDLERRAPAGTIVVGSVTRDAAVGLTDPRVDYAPAEHVLTGPGEEIWEVVGAEPGTDLSDGSAVVVNRERELTLLTELLDRTRGELEPQLVTVVGTPGVGKTRLIAELRAREEQGPPQPGVDARPAVWCEGRSLPYGEGVTFWALAEIVKSRAGIAATDSAEDAVRRLGRMATAVLGDARDAAPATEYLQRLVHPQPAADEDAGWLREAFTAWRRYLETLAAERPLVLVFEDLHWADDAMLDFVEHLADHAHGVPLLIVCLAWPELLDRRPGWSGGMRNATTTALGALSAAHTAELLDDLLGEQTLPAPRREELLSGSGGNPLFVEEYVRMLRERGGRDGGAERPGGGPPAVMRPPATVELLIGARIDDLEGADRALLADAAVLGEVFWSGGLTAVSGLQEAEVTAALHRLTRREFIRRVRQSSIPGQDEYRFRHLVIRDVAYGRLMRGDRAARHAAAAGWLEDLSSDRAGDQAEVIAHHYLQSVTYARAAARTAAALADLADRAGRALRRAGDRAFALATYPAAIRYYDQALELWRRGHPQRPELLLLVEELRLEVQDDADGGHLEEAYAGLLAGGDRVGAASAQAVLSALLWNRGQGRQALEHQRRAHELLEGTGTSPVKARVLAELAANYIRLNHHPEALAAGREAVAMARSFGLRKAEADARISLGSARTVLGDAGGVTDVRDGLAALERLSSAAAPRGYIYLYVTLSHAGELAELEDAIAAMAASAERFNVPGNLIWVESSRASVLYMLGRWDEADALATALIGQLEAAGGHFLEALSRCVRGKIRLARGDTGGAADDAARAADLAGLGDEHVVLAAAALRGAVLLSSAPDPDPEAHQLAADLQELVPGSMVIPFPGAELADLLARCGKVPPLEDRRVKVSPWLGALRAFGAGRPEEAAALYERMGTRADEALARLRAGERLAAAGDPGADDQLTRARAFYEEVRATGYLARIDTALRGTPPPPTEADAHGVRHSRGTGGP